MYKHSKQFITAEHGLDMNKNVFRCAGFEFIFISVRLVRIQCVAGVPNLVIHQIGL